MYVVKPINENAFTERMTFDDAMDFAVSAKVMYGFPEIYIIDIETGEVVFEMREP